MINQMKIEGGLAYTSIAYNGKLYLGGNFTSINGLPRSGFAEIDLSTGDLTSFAPLVSGYIGKFVLCGTKIVMYGYLTFLGGVSMSSNLAMFDPATHTFSDPIRSSGLVDISGTISGNSAKANFFGMVYHQNSGNILVWGNLVYAQANSPTIPAASYLLIFNPNAYVGVVNSPAMNSMKIRAADIDQSTNIMYCSGTTPSYSGYVMRAFDLTDTSNITTTMWQIAGLGYVAAGNAFVIGSKVYFTAGNGSGGGFISIAGVEYRGMVAFDKVFGTLDPTNWSVWKNAAFGEIYVYYMLNRNGLDYVFGNWTEVLAINNNSQFVGFSRPSFMVRDSTTHEFVGDRIAFNGPTIIHYIPPSIFYQNEPAYIETALFDEDKLHVFGGIPWVDGVECNGHYIMNIDGTRIQQRAAVFL